MSIVHNAIVGIRRHPLVVDSIFAAAMAAFAIRAGVTAEVLENQREIGPLGWTLLIATIAPVAVRRRWPVPAMWVSVAANMPYWILNYPDEPTGIAMLVCIYSVGAHVERPRSLHHGLAAITIIVAVGVAGVLAPEEDLPWFAIPAFLIMYGTAWVLGDNLRTRRAYTHELEQTAAAGAAQRMAEAQQAVAEERTRIAREMHDVVAHSMSVIVVQASAARRVLDHAPDQAADALEAIESTGRESLEEMRRILHVLRHDDEAASTAPAPGLSDFGRLADHYRSAGLPVDLDICEHAAGLPTSVELAAYRIVQESLTNTLRHAGPARAAVKITRGERNLEVRISDDGRGRGAGETATGQGLIGMRERVEAFGGSITIGPGASGGFAVDARIPLDSQP